MQKPKDTPTYRDRAKRAVALFLARAARGLVEPVPGQALARFDAEVSRIVDLAVDAEDRVEDQAEEQDK